MRLGLSSLNEYKLPTAAGIVLAKSPVSAPRARTISSPSCPHEVGAQFQAAFPQWRSRACTRHLGRLLLLPLRSAFHAQIDWRFLRPRSFAENTACRSRESCTRDWPTRLRLN